MAVEAGGGLAALRELAGAVAEQQVRELLGGARSEVMLPPIEDKAARKAVHTLIKSELFHQALASDTRREDGSSGEGAKCIRLRRSADAADDSVAHGKRTLGAMSMGAAGGEGGEGGEGGMSAAEAARRAWVLKDRRLHPLPYVSEDLAGIGGRLKAENSHFRVTERRDGRTGAGLLSGVGDHIYVTVEREGMNTLDVQKVRCVGSQHHSAAVKPTPP